MNIFNMAKKIKFLPIIFLCGNIFIFGQSNINLGGYFGGGMIGGNLPNQGSFTSSLFIDFNPGFNSNLSMRVSYLYIADFNLLLPENTNQYNPFIKGFSIKAMTWQSLSKSFYIEEGIGPLALNDRTFFNLNTWDYGIVFSVVAGLEFGKSEGKREFRLGAGTEYGLTLTHTFVRYLSFQLQAQYYL